jgi:PPOX class probable FMN-dependent enzyme
MSRNQNEHHLITTTAALEALYDAPLKTSIAKEIDHVNAHYRAFVDAAPFFALATVGPEGLDCSPRGDAPGFARVADPKTVLVPDRRGNNRIDSLRNIVRDPRVALLFLIPGIGETLRINGRAAISVDPELIASFAVGDKPPRSVIVVAVERVYFQCARALMRSKLWDASRQIERKQLPSTGTILADISKGEVGGAAYDREMPTRLQSQLY